MAEGVWHQVVLRNGLGVAAKLVEQEDGRWVVTEMYLHGDRITATDLRNVQPARLEGLANAHKEMLKTRQTRRQREPGEPEPTLAELKAGFEAANRLISETIVVPTRPRLTRPDGTDPEAFYRSVAAAYREHLTTTRAPAAAMADEAEVPVATAHRWIREARKRGFLPAGEQGRAG